MNQYRVAIIGATLWGNRGAEAMLVTTIGEIRQRQPNTKFTVYSYFPKDDRRILRDPDIRIFSARPSVLVLSHFVFSLLCWLTGLIGLRFPQVLLPESVDNLRQCDVLLDINGISFADGREKFLPFNIMMIWPAMLLKVPVVKLSQAMGPFNHPLNRISARLFLKRCRFVYARGEITAAHLREINFDPSRYAIAADIAFLYKPEYSLTSENDETVSRLTARIGQISHENGVVIGLVVSSVVYAKSQKKKQDYVGNLLRLIVDLGQAYHFMILPNATRQKMDTPRNNDIFVINAMRQHADNELPKEILDKIEWVDFDINTSSSRTILTRCDLIITSRFHGMISGLTLGVPTAVIGWSHKYSEVMSQLDMDEFVVDFSRPDLAQQLVTQITQETTAIRHKLIASLPQVLASSRKQFDELVDLLPHNSAHIPTNSQ